MPVPSKVVEWISKVLQPSQGAIQIQSITPNGAVEVVRSSNKQKLVYRIVLDYLLRYLSKIKNNNGIVSIPFFLYFLKEVNGPDSALQSFIILLPN